MIFNISMNLSALKLPKSGFFGAVILTSNYTLKMRMGRLRLFIRAIQSKRLRILFGKYAILIYIHCVKETMINLSKLQYTTTRKTQKTITYVKHKYKLHKYSNYIY